MVRFQSERDSNLDFSPSWDSNSNLDFPMSVVGALDSPTDKRERALAATASALCPLM
jgi:hypothetical protein